MKFQKESLYNAAKGGTGYAYTNTRVRVMKTRLLKSIDYQKIMKMSVNEIARFLGETDYKEEIDELASNYSGVNLVEYALMKNLERTFKKVFDFSIKSSHSQISLYFMKWDVWNLKMVLRGKYSNITNEEILNNLVVVGTLKEEFLKKAIMETNSFDEAVNFFKKTNFYEILNANRENIAKLEDALDIYYYTTAMKLSQPKMKTFIENQVKVINTINKERAEKAEIEPTLIPSENGLIKIPSNIEDKQTYLRKLPLKNAIKMMHTFKTDIGPVLGYFAAKETEINNLRMIVRGKHSELPEELIEKNIILMGENK